MTDLRETMPNAFVAGQGNLTPEEEDLVARRARLLGPAYRLMYETPLHFVRGEGVWLFDPQGQAYLDAYNNVTSLGHCNERVVEAVRRQAGLLATNTRYMHTLILDYAEKLLATFPDELAHVMFACTGSEANDLALRIAKSYTGGTGVIITETAYHGITESVSEFSPSLGERVPLGPHVRTVRAPDAYRSESAVGEILEADVRAAAADLKRHGMKPAIFIVDTLFSSDGVLAEPAGFLKGAVGAIREAGGLFVADEVQPGFGRTGTGMWGFERHGVVPDLVTLGKPMGNGQPISGVVMRPELVESFGRDARYFNTFGGNAVSCAAALAVLEVIENGKLVSNAKQVGHYLREGITALAERHPVVGDVRGAGLFIGVELVEGAGTKAPAPYLATKLVNAMRERRVLISICGNHQNVLKIRPPLIFTRENADLFIGTLGQCLDDL